MRKGGAPTAGNNAPPLLYALDRIVEIGLGNIVGIAVALLVLPARAHALLIAAAARVARLNADLLRAVVEGLVTDEGRPGLAALHAKIRAALRQVEAAADEASRERQTHLTDMPDPEPLVRILYRVRHDLVMIGRAASNPLPEPLSARLLPHLLALRDAAADLLTGLADALGAGGNAPSGEALDAASRAYAADADLAARDEQPAGDDAVRLFTLRFSFEQLAQDLRELGRRTDEMAGLSLPAH